MSEMFELSEKTALVTGSTRGLGRVIADGLADAGAHVVINGRDGETVKSTVEEMRAAGKSASTGAFDILDPDAVADGIARIESDRGAIDVLVNNAGIQKRAPLHEFSLDDWNTVLATNLTGPFIVTRAVARGMIAHNSGKIINMCSLMSELGRPTIAPYAASKGGMKMLTRAMAVEWAKYNIQVNGIGPGYFITEMTRALADDPDFDGWIKNRTPAARWGDPKELIGAAVFLASEASSFVNGQIIYVDGGILAAI
ncbi:MAG: SDR family oxidoreductase [Spirochaetaceae bacterium]|nr:MAG: SDR family oxidoreductase [Spirochaetaceae bacterium]